MAKFNRFIILLAAIVSIIQIAHAAEPTNYYKRAEGKSDEALMTALCNIIRNHTEVSYSSGLLAAFKKCDTDAQGYIIDIYSNCRYKPSDNGSTAKHMGEGYNREHSFPRSWFNGEVAPMNTDVFHIYPTDIHVNSQRSNYPYGVCANGERLSYGSYVAKGKLGKSTYPGYGGIVFEPDDEYKGDLARTYFYMATCYKQELPSWPGSANLAYSTNKYKAFSTWTIKMLMEWNRLDPVSEKEIKRNEAVYGIQKNRNPFIDHPELAEHIWGDLQGKPWPQGSDIEPAAISQPASGSTFDMGSTDVGTQLTYTINVKATSLTTGLSMTTSDKENFYASRNSFSASEANEGTSFTITFLARQEGEYRNTITLGNSEASTTFTVTATALPQGQQPDPQELGDSIMEDWEGCSTGGYFDDHTTVQGHTWKWDFDDAGIWSDNLRHGELTCRLGKTSSSSIAMAQDVAGTSAIAFWAGSYNSDEDATLRVEYSTDQGSTWQAIGTVTTTRGILQYHRLAADVPGSVRFRIAQTTGSRVNVDDITLFAQAPIIGDVNGDKEVNIADINTLIDIILAVNPIDEATLRRADVNKDDEINVADINAVINLIL
jgi:endonuclease I